MNPIDETMNRRILIVDDNETIHQDFRKILCSVAPNASLAEDEAILFGERASAMTGIQYSLDSAFQGQEALAKVQAAVAVGLPYALAFLDVRMPPGWDGIETIPHLWRDDPALHIVICSAYSDHSWEELINKLGLTDRLLILKKPFDAAEVRQVAVALTEKWNLARRARLRMDEVETIVEARTRDLETARAALTSARDAAESANRAKSAFLANMSHELRTPLTAILGFAENLFEWELSDAERRQAAQTILSNGEHLLMLLNDILDVSKIEAGKFVIDRTVCSPALIAREVIDLLRAAADQHGLDLILNVDSRVPQQVLTDPLRLRQILTNLTGNAIKFTRSGAVALTLRSPPAEEGAALLSFDVADSGIGMTPEQAARIFQPFQQADATTTRQYGGTGLGLYISKRLARLLGGDVSIVQTAPGSGTTMRATITAPIANLSDGEHPIADSDHHAREAAVSHAIKLSGRLLLVEDGPDNQRLLASILTRAGAEVSLAENGRDGMERALAEWRAGRPYKVILMDMQMPVMDGYEATRLLREAGYPGAIVALTAHAMSGDAQKCLNIGCDGYASKPIRRHELLRQIDELLRRPAAACEPAASAT